MDGSDDSDCEESGVRYLVSLMSETCTEFSKVVRDYREETTEEEYVEFISKGAVFKTNLEKLKVYDAFDKSAIENFEESLNTFTDSYEQWARKNGRLKNYKRKITELRLTGAEVSRRLMNGRKTVKMVDENEELGSKHFSTPINQKLVPTQVKFAKLSPKLDLLPSYQCHLCTKKYDWLKALNRHLKKNHAGAEAEVEHRVEVKHMVTCRMCKTKVRRDCVRRHLTEVHGVIKRGSAAILRGFVTLDEESWQPLFLEKGENDPDEESTMMVPINNGIISIFGVDFKVDEVAGNSEDKSGQSSQFMTIDRKVPSPKIDDEGPSRGSSSPSLQGVKRKLYINDEIENTTMGNKAPLLDSEEDKDEEIEKEALGGDNFIKESLPVIKVETFLVDVKNGEFWAASDVDMDAESFEVDNFEAGDSIEDCEFRSEMRRIRLKRRDEVEMTHKLAEKDGNKEFIDKFQMHLAHSKLGSSKDPKSLSSFRKQNGHLFYYEDSFLNFMTRKFGNDYNLSRHLCANSEDFLELPDPISVGEWDASVAGESGREEPSRRMEMLKSHARLRDFLYEELDGIDFGSSVQAYLKKDAVLKRIRSISVKISEKNFFGKLRKLVDQNKARKQEARELLFPSNNFHEQQAAKKWCSSDVCKAEEQMCKDIFNKTVTAGKCTERDFSKVANFVRFQVALKDRNRRSAYTFSNKEYAGKRPKWLPSVQKEDTACIVDRFELLPDGWNADQPKYPGQPESCWVIRLCGDKEGLKGGKETDIILTRETAELCQKLQDMKDIVIEESTDEDQFFVNMKNKPLSAMQRTPGSLLFKYMEVTGVHNPTVTSFRRAMEPIIQASPMKHVVQNIASHSASVGSLYYDKSGQNNRAHFVSTLAELESPLKESSDEVPEHIRMKRKVKERLAKDKALSSAKAFLQEDKRKKTRNFKCKVDPLDRRTLQEIFADKMLKDVEVFPDDTDWVQCFYRAVDSLEGTVGDKLRGIEEKIFKLQVRPEVEAELGMWNGSKEQNLLGDLKTAMLVKSSFRVYEKAKEKFERSYFKF